MSTPSRDAEPQDRLPGEPPPGPSARFEMPLLGEEIVGPGAVVSPRQPQTAAPMPIGGTSGVSTVVSVFGDVRREGHWTVAAGTTVVSVFGDITLDLRDATFEQREVRIAAYMPFGDLKVIVPAGVAVDCVGVLVFGDRKTTMRTTPGPDARRVVITTYGVFGDVKVMELAPGEKPPRWRDRFFGRA